MTTTSTMEGMATSEPLQEEQEAAPRRAGRPLQEERGTQNPEKFNGEEWLNIGIN